MENSEIKPYIRNKPKRNCEKDTILRKILIWAKKLKAVSELGGKCELCEESRLWTLCFHHKDPNEKEETINFLRSSKVRFSELMKEIKKCQLLCQNCHRQIHEKNDLINDRQRQNKKLCLEYKDQPKCQNCGYDKCDGSLEFHHNNPTEKEEKISKIINDHSWKTVDDIHEYAKKELDKCIVVCRNCHQTIHNDNIFIQKYLVDIENKSKTLKDKTEIDINKVIELGKLGLDRHKISKHLNCSPGRVWEILKANGLTTEKHTIDRKKILDLYESGSRICDIVRTTRYSKSSVIHTIKEYKNESHSRSD